MELHYDDWAYREPNESPQAISTKDFKQFVVKQVIPTFEGQRIKSQFATIILCSEKDCKSGFQSIQFNKPDQPVVDYTVEWMPQDYHQYSNYLAARPNGSGSHHAEHYLMEKLDYLLLAYLLKNSKLPTYIVLYSWITPCSSCTELIIDKLCTSPYDEIPTVVAYTTNSHAKGDNVEKARGRLRDCGFTVQQVSYPIYLPIKDKTIPSV